MIDLHTTQHALARMAQRGIQAEDIPLILAIGAEVPDGLLVRAKDVAELELQVKRFIRRLRHVQGKRIVARNGTLVTAFHAGRRQARSLLNAER